MLEHLKDSGIIMSNILIVKVMNKFRLKDAGSMLKDCFTYFDALLAFSEVFFAHIFLCSYLS